MRDKILALLKPSADTDLKLSVVTLFIGKTIESLFPRIESLEARQLQKGDKGDRGEKGDKGEKGDRGEAGIQGMQGLQGIPGKDGKDGKEGKKGKDGLSIVDAEISMDDHLVFKRSDGKILDAGELPKVGGNGSVFVSGNGYQITVSSTAPTNPVLNQLWLDIS